MTYEEYEYQQEYERDKAEFDANYEPLNDWPTPYETYGQDLG